MSIDTANLKPFFDRANVHPYPWYFADEVLTDPKNQEFFGHTVPLSVKGFRNGHIYGYEDLGAYDIVGESLLRRIITDLGYADGVEENIFRTSDELIAFCDKLGEMDIETLKLDELVRIYREYAETLKKVRLWGWIPVLLDGANTPHLSNYLTEKLRGHLPNRTPEEIGQFYSTLTSSTELSEVGQEENDRLKLLVELEHDNPKAIKVLSEKDAEQATPKLRSQFPETWKRIVAHAKKYEWLPYAYAGPTLSPQQTVKLLKDSLNQPDRPEQALQKINRHYAELPKQIDRLEESLNLPEDLRRLFRTSRLFMFLKDYRKGIYQKSYVAMDPVIEAIADRLEISPLEARYLTTEELVRLADDQDRTDILSQVKERIGHCVAVVKNGETEVLTGKPAEEILDKIMADTEAIVSENISELKGTIAFSGRARGTARLIAVPEDMSKMEEGDIMISPATNPDLIMAMQKAAAFVTDMGGITCHAAIVSREMKKPCLVGTKIATKIFHDGDLMEVDAVNGLVKKIAK